MKKIFKIFIFVLMPTFLYPCLWLEGTTIDGEYKQFDDKTISSLFLRNSLATSPAKNFKNKLYRDSNHTVEYEAVKEINDGKYDEAISKLLKIERKMPNRYETASNLGTAYELNGNLPLAIKWIDEGIKRNKNSHLGTEWLHVLILKTKSSLQKNPHLLEQKHIITLPREFDEETVVTLDSTPYTIAQIRTALFYQLRERMIFVKPKSPIVADLLYSFAKIEEQTTVLNEAEKLLRLAIEYGFSNKQEIEEIHSSASLANTLSTLRVGLYGAMILVLFIILYRYEKRRANKRGVTQISPLRFAITINLFLIISFLVGILLSMLILYGFSSEDPSDSYAAIIFYANSVLFLLLGIKISLQNLKLRRFEVANPYLSTVYTASIYSAIVLFFMISSQKYLWGFVYLSIAIFIYLYLSYKLKIDG